MEMAVCRVLAVCEDLILSPSTPVEAGHGGVWVTPELSWLLSLVLWVSSGLNERLPKEVR